MCLTLVVAGRNAPRPQRANEIIFNVVLKIMLNNVKGSNTEHCLFWELQHFGVDKHFLLQQSTKAALLLKRRSGRWGFFSVLKYHFCTPLLIINSNSDSTCVCCVKIPTQRELIYFTTTFVAWGVTVWSLQGRQPPTRLSCIFSHLNEEPSPGCSSRRAYLGFKTRSCMTINDTDTLWKTLYVFCISFDSSLFSCPLKREKNKTSSTKTSILI